MPEKGYSRLKTSEKAASKKNTAAARVDEDEEEKKSSKAMMCFIIVLVLILVLASVDAMTTKYFKRMCTALATWTSDNAPGSFLVFYLVIDIFIICCLPYGPLSVLSGALMVQQYGHRNGILIGGFALFVCTMIGGCVCFALARYFFRETVQRKLDNTPKLHFLKNLDRLIEDGQGIEMVVLIRLAPLPKGPTNYFLGTTAVSWNEFLIGSCIVNLPMCFLDVCIGAGAKSVKADSPLSIAIFTVCIACFFFLICYVGMRAKKKLMALDQEDEEAAAAAAAGEAEAGSVELGKKGGASSAAKKKKKKKKEAAAATTIDTVDDLQIIGLPNDWSFPDRRLVMRLSDDKSRTSGGSKFLERVDALRVQLTSQTFSFQVVSARAGWAVRVFPRDAKPKLGMHASQEGVLFANERAGVSCAVANGLSDKSEGHGHNFHIIENAGDSVTIFVGRKGTGEPANGSEDARVDHQIDSVDYQVWYSVDARATKLPESAPRPKKKGGKAVIDFEKDPSVDFLGGDGVEISKKRSDSMRGKVAERA